jgi:multidrug efflux pump subunit AcrA (membrane-fusion protein)
MLYLQFMPPQLQPTCQRANLQLMPKHLSAALLTCPVIAAAAAFLHTRRALLLTVCLWILFTVLTHVSALRCCCDEQLIPPHATFAARREKQDAQAAAAAAQAQMVTDVAAARAELAAAQRQARAEVEKASAAADSRMRDYVDKFRDQVRSVRDVQRTGAVQHMVYVHAQYLASMLVRVSIGWLCCGMLRVL